MFNYFIENLLISIAAIVIFQITGFLFARALKLRLNNSFLSLLLITFGGFLFFSTFFAIWQSGGKTVMAGYILIFLFLYYDYRSTRKANGQRRVTTSVGCLTFRRLPFYWLKCLFVLVLVLSYKLAFPDKPDFLVEPVYNDYVFYAKLSKYLLETGIENSNLDYIFSTGAIAPYHYTDIWINSLLVYLTQKNAVVLMILSTYSIGLVMVWTGFMAIWEQYFSRHLLGGVVSVSLLFFSGLYWGSFLETPFWEATSTFAMHTVNYAKLFPLFVAIVLLILSAKGNKEYLVSSLLIFPIINISTLPGIGLVILCLLLYRLLKEKFLDIPSLVKSTVFVSFIAAIYLLFGGGAREDFLSLQHHAEYIRTAVNIMGGSFIQLVAMYLPVVVVFLLQRPISREGLYDALVMVAMFGCFALPWAVLHRSPNSVQLFSNFFIPFTTCVSVDFCLRQIKCSARVNKVAVALLFLTLPLVSVARDISDRINLTRSAPDIENKLAQIQSFFDTVDNPLGVYFLDEYSWASKNTVFGALDMKFQQFVDRPGFHTVSLSIVEIPLDSASLHYGHERALQRNTVFGQYVKRNYEGPVETASTEAIKQIQVKFIREYEVDYILTNFRYELPTELCSLVLLKASSQEWNVKLYSVIKDD